MRKERLSSLWCRTYILCVMRLNEEVESGHFVLPLLQMNGQHFFGMPDIPFRYSNAHSKDYFPLIIYQLYHQAVEEPCCIAFHW